MSKCSLLVRLTDAPLLSIVTSIIVVAELIVAASNCHTLSAAEKPNAIVFEKPDAIVFEKPDAIVFEKHVRPILKEHCFHCHGEEPELAGGLDLRLVHLMLSGGDSGPAVEVGKPSESLLYDRIVRQEMPPGSKKLNEEESLTIARWIELGATTARPEPRDPAEAKFTEEELAHWAFQPPVKPALPASVEAVAGGEAFQPIDSFVAIRLAQAGSTFAPPADRANLLRRVKFDLHGLPPTKEELAQFLSDHRLDAYERMVDRLLASPQYGVRWARHWLDVVGYAESDGNIPKDQPRPHAWHYRDYVINSLNNDKPYDQFLIEQLAGDELIEGAPDGNNMRHVELMAATGLLRMPPDVTQTDNTLMDRNQAVAEVLNVIGTGILGVTVGCAVPRPSL